MRFTTTIIFAILISTLGSQVAFAGPDEAAQDAAPTTPQPTDAPVAVEAEAPAPTSPYQLVRELEARMRSYKAAPKATYRETAVRGAWRVALGTRAPRMHSRMKRVAKVGRWETFGRGWSSWTPKAKSLPSVLRDLAGLYVDVSAAEKQIAKARIVRREVIKFGFISGRKARRVIQREVAPQDVPEDEPVDELDSLDESLEAMPKLSTKELAELRRSLARHDASLAKLSNEELAEELRRRAIEQVASNADEDADQGEMPDAPAPAPEGDMDVEQPMPAPADPVAARLMAIRGRIDAIQSSLTDDLGIVRDLVGALQVEEETRLSDIAARITDPRIRLEAVVLLGKMANTSELSHEGAFERASHYGSAVRKWLQARKRMIDLVAGQ